MSLNECHECHKGEHVWVGSKLKWIQQNVPLSCGEGRQVHKIRPEERCVQQMEWWEKERKGLEWSASPPVDSTIINNQELLGTLHCRYQQNVLNPWFQAWLPLKGCVFQLFEKADKHVKHQDLHNTEIWRRCGCHDVGEQQSFQSYSCSRLDNR